MWVNSPDERTVALGLGSSLPAFSPDPNGAGPDLSVIELGPDGIVQEWQSVKMEDIFEYPFLRPAETVHL